MANGKLKKSKKKIFIFGGLGLLLLIVIILVIASGNKEEIFSVQTEQVQKRNITQVVSATGKINPVEQVILRPEVTGEIVELPVAIGSKVKKGQLLIRLKPEQYIARKNRAFASLEAAQADLKIRKATIDQVEAEYKRIQGMFEKGLASESQLEQAKSNYLQSEGAVEAANANVMQADESYKDAEVELAKTVIYSPIEGTITELFVELSERVLGSSFSQGTHLMTVANLNIMEATVEVDENDVVLISIGDTAEVQIDAFGDSIFEGKVTEMGNAAITTGLGTQDEVVNFEVKIQLIDPKENIRPGMSCDADIKTETKLSVLSIPIQCVTARTPKDERRGEESESEGESAPKPKNGKTVKPEEVVFAVESNEAKLIKVETGISDDTYIEIINGLNESQEVVTGPYRAISKELEDGSKLMVQKKKSESN
ncbi:MAG: efflux transporter periplasmic adaptor subunit [Ignavibacteria bacterium RBG_13_36_8]|nr:MAG: efflux transporter periplasmic adaptor subunit [Ignavibacteria bacterium RBG_13_36_8]